MTCTFVPSVNIEDENLQNPSGKLLACTGYWRARLLHHGHRNKIVGMGVHKVLLLVVPQAGGPAQGERSRGTIQPYKKVTLAPRPAPPAPSWLHIQTSFWLIPRSSPVFGRIHDCVMCQRMSASAPSPIRLKILCSSWNLPLLSKIVKCKSREVV